MIFVDLLTIQEYLQDLQLPYAFNVAIYFTLRAGGDTKSTFMMDAMYMWIIPVPVAMMLSYLTKLPVTTMFLIVQMLDIPKMLFGLSRYKKGRWVKNLANEEQVEMV